MKPHACLRLVIATMLVMGALCPQPTLAQTARFYWKSLSGGYGIPLIYQSMSGNTNPFDPSHSVVPGANFSATMAMAGVAHTFSLSNRAASLAVIAPMGRISGEVTAGVLTLTQQAGGFGDPMIEFDINILGPRAQKSIPDAMRYEPGFSIDLLADLAVPIGKYDSSQALNIGLNRWYGRVAMPVILQLGPWVPGRRTTLEFLPSLWLFGDNTDYVGGQTLETDPAFQLEAHLTRDFTEKFWGSLEAVWYVGGKASVNGVSGESLNNVGLGFMVGYTINDNLGLRFGYKSTVNDRAPEDLRMDVFTVSLVFGWHPIIEGSRRLRGQE